MESLKISSLSPALDDIVRTKPVYSRKTFLWEIQSMESIMTDGVQRAISCEFEIKGPSTAPTTSETSSKWRLALDLEDIEPAITVHKIAPIDKIIYFRLAVQAMKSATEETDVINHPNAKLFYDSARFNGVSTAEPTVITSPTKQMRKFSLHKQLDYGCSYTSWFKDVLIEGSLLLKVDFETCESVCY